MKKNVYFFFIKLNTLLLIFETISMLYFLNSCNSFSILLSRLSIPLMYNLFLIPQISETFPLVSVTTI